MRTVVVAAGGKNRQRGKQWTGEDPLQVWVMKADGTDRHPITRTFGWGIASWAPAS